MFIICLFLLFFVEKCLNKYPINNIIYCIAYFWKRMQNASKKQTQDAFLNMYKSGIRASYFGHMADPKMVQKSKIQISNIQENAEQEIDEKTFKLQPNFKRPQPNFQVRKKNGQCFIQKPSIFGCFSRRRALQLSLSNSKLSIISSDQLVRFADLSAVAADVIDHGKHISIRFQGTEQQLYIQPTNLEQIPKWVSLLNEVIKATEAKTRHRTYLAKKTPNFFHYEHLLNQQFEREANSGDILLFKSQHSAATVQRLFTNSQYDHVGVILRNQKNQIFVYQSTSNDGVGLTPWRQMIKYEWYTYTDKITWRKLNAQIGPREIQKIQAFVAKTLGKGFQINLDKLFKFKSTLERTSEDEQNKTYFCSQLIARLYKQLGLLDQQKSSTNYYPVDFSQKTTLKFVKPGVSLSNQKIISFDS